MMSTRMLESGHHASKPSCDLFGEDVVAGRSDEFSSWVLEQIIDVLEFLSFLQLILNTPMQISLSRNSSPSGCLRIVHIRSLNLPQWSAIILRISPTLIRVLTPFMTEGVLAIATRGRRV